MKKLSFILLCGLIACQSCNNGNNRQSTADSIKNADSIRITNKEAETMINAPDTSMSHGTATTVDAKSTEFAMKAANGGMMEVDLGRWAQDHASSLKVKEFGAMMVADHTKANDELKSIAASKRISLPGMVEGDEKKHMDDLMAKKGKDFDKAYVNMMVDDHKKDVAEFEKASKNLPDSTLKHFAARTLPVLQRHYTAIKSIKSKI